MPRVAGIRVPRPYEMCLSSQHSEPTHIYTLSLHDALPISERGGEARGRRRGRRRRSGAIELDPADRQSTRLNSSHQIISYAVFCLKKKTKLTQHFWVHYNYSTPLVAAALLIFLHAIPLRRL